MMFILFVVGLIHNKIGYRSVAGTGEQPYPPEHRSKAVRLLSTRLAGRTLFGIGQGIM